MEHDSDRACFERVHRHSVHTLQKQDILILPELSTIEDSRARLHQAIPQHGIGIEATTDHLLQDIAPTLNASSLTARYYGFVIGGITPAARVADALVSTYDQNPMVHLPDQSIATNVEDKALRLLMDLLHFEKNEWSGVFSTGATASNVLGLACGREHIVNQRIKDRLGPDSHESVGSSGLLKACRVAGVEDIHIYATMAHSSLYKASSILGLGRSCVKDISKSKGNPAFDLRVLEEQLASDHDKSVSIVVVSCGEVNTGLFATYGDNDLRIIRKLCKKYSAWLHVDGAFGIFARVLEGLPGFERVAQGAQCLELADSVAGDGHKLLNVPYDCGFFFCRYPDLSQLVFQNPGAAYLNNNNATTAAVKSPLDIGIENSRRFRGLPVYATLIAYGHEGYQDMLKRQIIFARNVAAYIFDHPAFDLLPKDVFTSKSGINQDVFIIVLFRATNRALNEVLVQKINASNKMYVSGTVWEGGPATRIAVSNWQVDPNRDLEVVKSVLEGLLR
ncbi:hypothetical protein JMJ35_002500 [Cladonia borealis]|uniref:Tyrosine decarboxylase n=1 Tax=Cladonia borealis TaxID=184061 RepID=A0AA39R7Y4_9LECA|nr:hypothetical protein JMJ35_002500 [Cladonia borealis]